MAALHQQLKVIFACEKPNVAALAAHDDLHLGLVKEATNLRKQHGAVASIGSGRTLVQPLPAAFGAFSSSLHKEMTAPVDFKVANGTSSWGPLRD